MIEPAKIQVRITDVDILGHVNNAIYLTYFEIARVHYFTQLVGSDWDWLENGVVLVQNEVQYHLPVFLQDQPEIHIFCNKIGQKSFTLSYELYVKGELRTSGSSTLVGFNSKLQTTIEIPEKMRASLQLLPQK
ncbi:MAG: acyl-CoA thioesterase [Flavobacteriia bacterium]|jgi:acyl-CoA thioester hydrolase|nr:acyl-CoA thioesterase [Cryomorphaceae bacterium]NDE04097.1 acyl-CoA thioesterase [Flavobacteriia bacterium]